jgi:hypothetical protein
MLPIVAIVLVLGSAGPVPCDIAIESAGGSTAGSSFTFTVSSTATPVSVTVSVGGASVHTASTGDKQESITVTIPEDGRGKTLEIVAENKDGCLVSWTETVQ